MEPLHPDLRRVATDDRIAALHRAAAAAGSSASRTRPRLGRGLVHARIRVAQDTLPALVR